MTRTASVDIQPAWSIAMFRTSSAVYKWGGGDEHLPVGADAINDPLYRPKIKYNFNWTGMAKILSAELLVTIKSPLHLDARDSDITIYAARVTSEISRNAAYATVCGGDGFLTGDPWDDYTNRDTTYWSGSTSNNNQYSIDVTTIVDDWAPTTVLKSTGAAGGNLTNYGISLSTAGNPAKRFEIWSAWAGTRTGSSAYRPVLRITYEVTNEAPYTPTLTGPTSGSTTTDTTPLISASGSGDIDGDNITTVSLEYGVASGNGSGPTYGSSTNMSISGGSGGASWTATASPSMSRGNWYSFRVRAQDEHGAWSAYSSTRYVYINSLPTANITTYPVLEITNLNDVAAWTSTGQHAIARVKVTYSDPDGDRGKGVEVRVKTSSGGVAAYTYSANIDVANGSTVTCDLSGYKFKNGVTYYVDARFKDAQNEWNTSYSTERAVRVRWSQAIYEHNAGASSSQFQLTTGSVGGSSPSTAYLYRTATGAGGAGAGSWKSDISQAQGTAYVNILVRLAIGNTTTTTTSLADMTMTYSTTTNFPERWVTVGTDTGNWELDESQRRYGTRALRYTRTTSTTGGFTSAYVYPVYSSGAYSIPVVQGRQYTLSGWIKTDGAMQYSVARIVARRPGGSWYSGYVNVTDTSSEVDGWKRTYFTFTALDNTIGITCHFDDWADGVGDTAWFDAIQLEEGTVATTWKPGGVGSTVIDAGGISVDANAGGTLRLKGSNGDTRDTVEIGSSGLVFGGDTQIHAPSANQLRIEGGLDVGGDVHVNDKAIREVGYIKGNDNLTIDPGSSSESLYLGNDAAYVRPGGHFVPLSDGTLQNGSPNWRWSEVNVNQYVVVEKDSGAGATYLRTRDNVVSNNNLGILYFGGEDNTSTNRDAAYIVGRAKGTWTSTSQPSEIYIRTLDTDNTAYSWYFQSNGALTIPGDINVNSGYVFTGLVDTPAVRFPDTQSSNSDANVLDDYEEGTWTPAIGATTGAPGTAYSTQTGYYTKIGRLVYVDADVVLTGFSAGSASGSMTITGLPFSVSRWSAAEWATSSYDVGGNVHDVPLAYPGTTRLQILQVNDNGTWGWRAAVPFTGGWSLRLSCVYHTST